MLDHDREWKSQMLVGQGFGSGNWTGLVAAGGSMFSLVFCPSNLLATNGCPCSILFLMKKGALHLLREKKKSYLLAHRIDIIY
jgi:hypothetical protein